MNNPSPSATATATTVIDACALVYDDDCWRAYLHRLADHAPQYLTVFARPFAAYFGADRHAFASKLADSAAAEAVALLLPPDRPSFDLEGYLAGRAAAGVAAEIAMGSPRQLPDGTTVNDRVAAFAARAPGRLHAWAGISLRDGPKEAVRELERCLGLGMTGFNIIPFLDAVDVADEAFAPVFELADDARLPLWLHTGQHFAARVPADVSHWRQVDALASRYPGMRIVAGHAGWPWVLDTVAVALRHDNVLLEFSSHRARTMPAPGSGWEPLLHYGRAAARRKVMFGTSTWVNPEPVKVLADEVRTVLRDAQAEPVAADWLHRNAARLLNLPNVDADAARAAPAS
jgi:uncharacterized protein